MTSVSVLCQFRPARSVQSHIAAAIYILHRFSGINERCCWCLSSMGTGSTGRISKLSVPLLKSIDLGVRAIDKMVKGEEKEKDTHKKKKNAMVYCDGHFTDDYWLMCVGCSCGGRALIFFHFVQSASSVELIWNYLSAT
ncbi:hypothetical protein T10_3081 [Trichinella papuae]|uniref:Uncharacterized protein n=1 Tax=Trichinella papuae TaxID=268474 RepID=A0A0V1MSN6_9BILA|nr:hypothetical protein T10_3081 [Trichinella papuae]